MDGITMVGLILGGLLAAAGAITTLGGAVEKVIKAWRAAKAPAEHRDDRLDALEDRMTNVERKLENDKKHLDGIDAGNRVTQLALLALLDHGIDGNNVKQMQEAKAELQQHLINR